MNWQMAHRQIFVGLTDSYENIFQSVRRLWRFGQTKTVLVHLLTTEAEQAVKDNIARKDAEVNYIKSLMKIRMGRMWNESGFVGIPSDFADSDLFSTTFPQKTIGNARMINGDCVIAMDTMLEPNSVDLAITSPPFGSMYRYSDDARDLSNSRDDAEFARHMQHFAKSLFKVLKPGRLAVIHVMNVVKTKGVYGFASIRDTRGCMTDAMLEAGFALHSEIAVKRDPVEALIITKATGLFYRTFCNDASICRQSLPDYLVVCSKPGVNEVPITHDPEVYSLDLWKKLACCIWETKHSDVINRKKALANIGEETVSDDEDNEAHEKPVATKHPTPLALGLIRDVVELWSNEGEVVLDPFSGFGSTGLVCKEKNRQYVGVELSSSYYNASLKFV